VQEEDIAAEAASEQVGMISYDIKKVVNYQEFQRAALPGGSIQGVG
jgi:hypothetical protein